MSYTPGPWMVNGHAIEQDRPLGQLTTVVAYVEDEVNDDWLANATLIAAAPDLLAALLLARAVLRIVKDDQALAIIDAAIAKATEGQT